MRKQNGCLNPSFAADAEVIAKMKDGVDYQFNFTAVRSASQHRLFFALINEAFNNLPEEYDDVYMNPEQLRKAVLMAAGYVTPVVNMLTGEVTWQVDSMNYATMSKPDFEKVFDDCCRTIRDRFWPDMDLTELKNNLRVRI